MQPDNSNGPHLHVFFLNRFVRFLVSRLKELIDWVWSRLLVLGMEAAAGRVMKTAFYAVSATICGVVVKWAFNSAAAQTLLMNKLFYMAAGFGVAVPFLISLAGFCWMLLKLMRDDHVLPPGSFHRETEAAYKDGKVTFSARSVTTVEGSRKAGEATAPGPVGKAGEEPADQEHAGRIREDA